MYEAERGLVDLRQGRLLYVSGGDQAAHEGALVAAVDGLRRATLDELRRLSANGSVRLAVTPHRARVMGGPSDIRRGLSISLNGTNAPDEVFQLAAEPRTEPSALLDPREVDDAERGGLLLARLGRLLPAIVSVPAHPGRTPGLGDLLSSGAALRTTTAQIDALAANTRVELVQVSRGPVPLEDAEHAHFFVFREANGLLDHVAVVIGDPECWPDPVPVRLHSACLTGDLFNSLRCDCGEQLRGALRIFTERGGGVLLYLGQEGRGIGLGNKLRAYVLQEGGLDTIDADGALGFGADERQYHSAVEILRLLRISRVLLLTNNPEKVQALRNGGIEVADRVPLFGRLNRHNFHYVSAKVHRAGHWLTEMLSSALPGK
jgi:GTP cyclohydrolase II